MALTVSFDMDGCRGSFTTTAGVNRMAKGAAFSVVALVGLLFVLYGPTALFPVIVAGFAAWQLASWIYKAAPNAVDLFLHREVVAFEVKGTTLRLERASGHRTYELLGMRVVRSPTQIDLYGAMGTMVTLVGDHGDEATIERLGIALTALASREGSHRAEVPAALEGISTHRT